MHVAGFVQHSSKGRDYRSSASILLFMHTEINGPWDSCLFFPPEVLITRDSDGTHM